MSSSDDRDTTTSNKPSATSNKSTATSNKPNKPNKPSTLLTVLRKPKLHGIAAFDLIGTMVASYYLAKGARVIGSCSQFVVTVIIFIILMIAAVLIHRVTDTPTMLNHYLGYNTLEEVLENRK